MNSETPRQWKSVNILRVGGTILRQGVFQGHPVQGETNPHAYKPQKITPEVIEKVFKNFNGHVPLFIGHEEDPSKTPVPIGSAFKLGVGKSLEDLKHEGFVWDQKAMNRIENEGLDDYSPEIDFQYDPQGNIVDANLLGIVFTRNPAIQGTQVERAVTAFSVPQGGVQMTGEPVAPAAPAAPVAPGNPAPAQPGPSGLNNPPVFNVIMPQAPGTPTPASPPSGTPDATAVQINALSARMAEQGEMIKNLVATNQAMKNTQVATLSNEIKALGIEKPEAMIADLPVEAQIKMLTSIKEAFATKNPLGQPGGSQATPPGPKGVEDATREILKGFGISDAEYKKLMES